MEVIIKKKSVMKIKLQIKDLKKIILNHFVSFKDLSPLIQI